MQIMHGRSSLAALVVCVALLANGRATASLQSVDVIDPSGTLVPNGATRDTATGLDWLDLDLTVWVSFDQILAGAGPGVGWVNDGWQHATTAEACDLLQSNVASFPCPDQQTNVSYEAVHRFRELMQSDGVTDIGLTDDGPGGNSYPVGLIVFVLSPPWATPPAGTLNVRQDVQPRDGISPFGNALVRPAACDPLAPSSCCANDSDCNDGNPCTTDTCIGNVCSNIGNARLEFPSEVDNGTFVFLVTTTSPTACRPFDPPTAVGYDYAVDPGSPLITSVVLPAVGDGQFELYRYDTVDARWAFDTSVSAEVEHVFPGGGVDRFRILGIEEDAGLDPSDQGALVTGLEFAEVGSATLRMTPISVGCPSAPRSGCQEADSGLFLVREVPPGRQKVLGRFKGPVLGEGDLGDPVGKASAYSLCVHDALGNLAGEYVVNRAGETCGTDNCWRGLGTPPGTRGYRYGDSELAADGIASMLIKAGGGRPSLVKVKGRSAGGLPLGVAAALNGSNGATIQLLATDSNQCLSKTLPLVVKDSGGEFKAKGN